MLVFHNLMVTQNKSFQSGGEDAARGARPTFFDVFVAKLGPDGRHGLPLLPAQAAGLGVTLLDVAAEPADLGLGQRLGAHHAVGAAARRPVGHQVVQAQPPRLPAPQPPPPGGPATTRGAQEVGGPGRHGHTAEPADAILADEAADTAAADTTAGVLSERGVARRERVAAQGPHVLREELSLAVFGVALRLDERERLFFWKPTFNLV